MSRERTALIADLKTAVESHRGVFLCEQIRDRSKTKEVAFAHKVVPRSSAPAVPSQLYEFYETFGELLLYHDSVSGDAAYYLAPPAEFDGLSLGFEGWLEDLDEHEEGELLPDWLGQHLVIGEIPRSGNYLLMPLAGDKAGFIYEFEHDGFEFIECASSVEEFVLGILDLDNTALCEIASHMRFVENDDWATQWWIVEMRDSRGNFAETRA